MNTNSSKSRVAIIGSGISGLSCAYFLNEKFDIKLYEKNNYIGGHSNTVDINYNDKEIAVDTGFIVFNHQTYPNLKAFFSLLEVEYEKSNMSFGVKISNPNIEYAGTNLNCVFAQRKNLLNPKFYLMLKDILHFNKVAEQILKQEIRFEYTLNNFLKDLKVGQYFCDYYLLPMASAIWSTPLNQIGDYPAYSFINFFKNHGLLTLNHQPQWYTVSKGSRQYVNKICKNFINKISINDGVKKLHCNAEKKWIVESQKTTEIFDFVIIATHADQALNFINNPSSKLKTILSSFGFQKNHAVLHKDSSVMPRSKKAWASWIYSHNNTQNNQGAYNKNNLSVSYWMNNLQNIDNNFPLFVTLNPNAVIRKSDIFAEFEYEHPVFDTMAIKAQADFEKIQGIDNLYFCGAYQANGFHEDGINSAIRVINKLNIKTPWQ